MPGLQVGDWVALNYHGFEWGRAIARVDRVGDTSCYMHTLRSYAILGGRDLRLDLLHDPIRNSNFRWTKIVMRAGRPAAEPHHSRARCEVRATGSNTATPPTQVRIGVVGIDQVPW